MDTNKIVEEWFYRLPKGYALAPYTDEELKVLNEVLDENGLSLKEDVDVLDQAFLDAKPVKDLDEEIIVEVTIDDNQAMESLEKVFANNKEFQTATTNESGSVEKIIGFLKALPGGKSLPAVEKMLAGLSKTESNEFVKEIGKLTNYNELVNETPYKSVGIEKTLYDMEPPGVGRGELWLAWKIPGVQISGGNKSYDVEMNIVGINENKFEVKAYHSKSNTKKPFRLGTHGILGRFDFWKNILDSSILIQKITSIIDPDNDGMAELGNKIAILNDNNLKLAIAKGEIGQGRINDLLDFYEEANKYLKTIEKPNTYDIVQIKSSIPGNPSKYYSIDPSSLEDIIGKKISNPVSIDDDKNKSRLTQRLLADPYVQNPSKLRDDINDAIQEVTDQYKKLDAGFLVFRADGIKISANAELLKIQDLRKDLGEPRNIATLSMGRLYVKEKADSDTADREES